MSEQLDPEFDPEYYDEDGNLLTKDQRKARRGYVRPMKDTGAKAPQNDPNHPTHSPEGLAKMRAGWEKAPWKGGGRRKPRIREATEHSLEKLEPKALKILEDQLDSGDEKTAFNAAVKILEWSRGKPTATVKQETTQVSKIVYATEAALPLPELEPRKKADLELEPGDFVEEPDDAEA